MAQARPAVREAVAVTADPLLQPAQPNPQATPTALSPLLSSSELLSVTSPRSPAPPQLRLSPAPGASTRLSSTSLDDGGDTPPGSVAGETGARSTINHGSEHSYEDSAEEQFDLLARLHTLTSEELTTYLHSSPSPATLVRQLSLALANQRDRTSESELRVQEFTEQLAQAQREHRSEAHVARAREQAVAAVARSYGAGEGELERALARVSKQRSAAQQRRGQQLRLGKDLQDAMGAALSESTHLMPPPLSRRSSSHITNDVSSTTDASLDTGDRQSESFDEGSPPVVLDALTGKPVPVALPEATDELDAAAAQEMSPDSISPPDRELPRTRRSTPSVSSHRELSRPSDSLHTRSDSALSHNSISPTSSVTTTSRKDKEISTSFTGWLFGTSKSRAAPATRAEHPDPRVSAPEAQSPTTRSRPQSILERGTDTHTSSTSSYSAPQEPAALDAGLIRSTKKAGALNLFGSLPWRRSIDAAASNSSPGLNANSHFKSTAASLPSISDEQPAVPSEEDPRESTSTHPFSDTDQPGVCALTLPPSTSSTTVSTEATARVPAEDELTPTARRRNSGHVHQDTRIPRLGPSLFHPSQLYQSVSHAHHHPVTPIPNTNTLTRQRTVELKPMLPREARPPTLAADPILPVRPDSYDPGQDPYEVYGGFDSSGAVPSRSDTALTDRYGFMYAGTPADVRLLRQAKAASAPAPACLAGTRVERMEEEEEDWESGVTAEDASSYTSGGTNSPASDTSTGLRPIAQSVSGGSVTSASGRRLSTMTSQGLVPPKARALAKSSGVVVSTRSEDRNSPSDSLPNPDRLEQHNDTLPATATVKSLLRSLDELYDSQQLSQKSQWDIFLAERQEKRQVARRQKTIDTTATQTVDRRPSRASTNRLALHDHGEGGENGEDEDVTLLHHNLALVGIAAMGTTVGGREDWNAFVTLCLSGIPLRYRSQVWAECSGANDLAEPGRYEELLALSGVPSELGLSADKTGARAVTSASTGSSAVLAQIDLDVHRTLPTNVFFGGDGPGVPKLRRVLAAFSWYDVDIGYCQGMNNLAATLLLIDPSEEKAFWLLVCLIEKILPRDYYTSVLLTAQADQRVLNEYLIQLLPPLSRHLDNLGVDLPTLTFGWFLSLYTECLPVETLFRVWDLIFVEGTATLFRVALAVLSLHQNELLQCESTGAVHALLRRACSSLFHADKLIQAASSFRENVTTADVTKRRARHAQALRSEMGLDNS